jgi:Beta/Gamma crystallin
MVLRIVLAFVVGASFLSSPLSAQRRGLGYAGITVYENPDFRGRSVTFREGISDLREHGLNDRITSLEIDGNQAWEVCRDVEFAGGCRVFTGTIEDLREEGWNDRISSLRPAGPVRGARGSAWGNSRNRRSRDRDTDSRLVFYDRANYRGDARDIASNSANLGAVGDRARSVRVYGGTWELCEGVLRSPRCITVTEDVPDLHRLGLRNGVTSAREVARQSNGRWW